MISLWCYVLIISFQFTQSFTLRSFSPSVGKSTVFKLCPYLKSTKKFAEKDLEGIRGMKGYYRRPSRAIEKGGGFFVPGLEGERIRVLTAGALLIMFAANRTGVQVVTTAQLISEVTGLVVTVLLFLQGLADAFSYSDVVVTDSDRGSYLSIIQSAKVKIVESVVLALLQTCREVCHIIAVSADGVIVEAGAVSMKVTSNEAAQRLMNEVSNLTLPSQSFALLEDMRFMEAAGLSIPVGTKSVVLFKDSRSWLWLIASKRASAEFGEDATWMQSLIAAPME